MKIKISLSIGFVGCRKERTVDTDTLGYSEEEWKELSDPDKDEEVLAYITSKMIDIGWNEVG